jgi:uncharacterized metal-binding protein YceD (DUF177 family)
LANEAFLVIVVVVVGGGVVIVVLEVAVFPAKGRADPVVMALPRTASVFGRCSRCLGRVAEPASELRSSSPIMVNGEM